MVNEVFESIAKAEAEAQKIIDEAIKKARGMISDNQKAIDALHEKSAVETAKKVKATANTKPERTTVSKTTTLKVDKTKLDKAKKYINDEFRKRYIA